MRHLPHIHISVVSIGAVVTLIGTFLTWVRSGETPRSSYEVFAIVDRLGFSPDGVVGWALRLWPLVPLMLALSVVAWWVPSVPPVAQAIRVTVAVSVALYAGLTAVAVSQAPESAIFGIGPGEPVTIVGALMILAGVGWALLVHRPRPRGEITPR